ncbi:MAG: CusA/CzcA family heavy metal efflux RND transporter [Nitrospira sp.]|nr:CusA/CzcA family heavy metal efflux RND transporter [Nitrospira sp.]MCP9442153.1 CusA/CzcA family heavy metal efflux RND transporter [Nitrospira sp.]
MIARIVEISLEQRFLVVTLGLVLLFGGLYAFHLLDVVAYPDPSPPMVEVITQYPGWSAEEIERQITVPIEVAMVGMPGLKDIRSISIFGLSDIKAYFDFGTELFRDRQEVLNRLTSVQLPPDAQPVISPWWAIAEIYRYELTSEGTSLTELKTIQDWQVRRAFKRVPGVSDVTTFGGTTKEYHVDIDPRKLISYGVNLSQVMTALTNSNANVGGNYLTIGAQSYNIRGLGLINNLDDIENVMVAEKEGTPVFIKTLGKVTVGHRVRLGKVGIDDRDDVVEGVVLLQRGYKALPVLEAVKKKVEELNLWKLPQGVQIKTLYDRTVLIHTTVETVLDVLISGMVLVFIILFVFLGHFRSALIVAMTVPMTLLFTFVSMVVIGESANLISLGAIDFGIIVDSTLIMVESIFSHLSQQRRHGVTVPVHIMRAAKEVGRPIFFATTIIVIAFLPLFTMTGVPGKIFAPMSMTYGLALSGALLMAFTLAPALCSLLLSDSVQEGDTRIVRWLHRFYLSSLRWALGHQRTVLSFAGGLLALAIAVTPFLGGEFMPSLEEGNLWVRATMPVDISFEEADQIATDIRRIFRQFPEVTSVVSQLGRPDDGTDPTSFFNAEFLVNLKPRSTWRAELRDKEGLIEDIERALYTIPGVTFNFSQVIQDNVQEAMSGVKGENSVKLYGRDLKTLEEKAVEIEQSLSQVHGVKDLGIFRVMGQPDLLIQVDRQACARYGLSVADVNTMVQAAVGGQVVTKVYEEERIFDLVVRFLPEYRQDVEAIGNILVSAPDGVRIPLKQVATISVQTGPFIIYRENNERYIPIKFSVRGRDLESTVKEAQNRIAKNVVLPERYRMEWHGEYDQLQEEKKRLAVIVPVSLLIVLLMVYLAVKSFKDAVLVLSAVPFALIGGVFSLFITRTDFSISAAVGFISLFGVAVQGALILIVRIRDLKQDGHSLEEAILRSAEARMRPVLMTSLAAAIGLLPASVATGVGAQAQQPLARVVVGGMLTASVLILVVLPVCYQMVYGRDPVRGDDQGSSRT